MVLYQGRITRPQLRACSWLPKRSGVSGRYFKVLKFASEKGLSLDTRGRDVDCRSPRSISNCEVVLAVMGLPLSV